MAVLYTNLISSAHFSFKDRKFFAEISDLGLGFRFERVYDDACDVGLTLVSARTGDEVVFAIHEEHRGDEGEVTHWTLKPGATRSRRGKPVDKSLEMVIFND